MTFEGPAGVYENIRQARRPFTPLGVPSQGRRSGIAPLDTALDPIGSGIPTLFVVASDASDLSKERRDFQCDGVTDDVEIQAALDDLPATGGRIAMSEGTFNVTADVDIPAGDVILEGLGSVWVAETGTGGISATTGGRHIIRGFHFTNLTEAPNSHFFIRMDSQAQITNNRFSAMTLQAVIGSDTTGDFGRYIITDNHFDDITLEMAGIGLAKLGLFVDSGGGSRQQDAIFANNMIADIEFPTQGAGRQGALVHADASQGVVQVFNNQAVRIDSLVFDGGEAIASHNVVDGVHDSGDHTPRSNIATFSEGGTLSTGTGVSKLPFTLDATIISVQIAVNTSPTDGDLIVDVHKNGTTIFTTQGNRPTVPAADADGVGAEATPDVTSITAGEYLTIDIDQVGPTIAGADLVVSVEWRPA